VAHKSRPAKRPIVDIGIPCLAYQAQGWWTSLSGLLLSEERYGKIKIGTIRASSSAIPDMNKNATVGGKRFSDVDENRRTISKNFLDSNADYIFWIDDDTAPPQLAITKLYNSGHDFIAGLYFANSTYNPVMFKRADNSFGYVSIVNYTQGELIEVDGIGMGCTLIHRSVYEKILDGHNLYRNRVGALIPIPKSAVLDKEPVIPKDFMPYIQNGIYQEPYWKTELKPEENFPFYMFHGGRGEDVHFCELAANVGIKPWVDTSVLCEHYKIRSIKESDFIDKRLKSEGLL